MELVWERFTVRKRHALTISRGTSQGNTNLWIRLRADGIEGWGEAAPFSIGDRTQTTDELETALAAIAPHLGSHHPLERQRLQSLLAALPSALRAGLDLACWDWLGQATRQPVWRLLGLDPQRMPALSVTVGIAAPEAAVARLRAWRQQCPGINLIKVKLGSPAGAEADRQMFSALQQAEPGLRWLVDANGGWDLETAIALGRWLAERGVEYLEQPLPRGREAALAELRRLQPLPVFLDESCWHPWDLPRLQEQADGFNFKLLKCGGLSELQSLIHTARACERQVMFGCYSDSSLLNSAAAQLGPLADWLDLDSHLNLLDDPFAGVQLKGDRLQLSDRPGLGVTRAQLSSGDSRPS